MGVPVVVCLHGLGRLPADWNAVAPRLGQFGRVVTPALPRDVRRAQEIAAASTPDGAVVVGHSMGAIIALLMAAERVKTVRGVVASSPFFPPALNGRSLSAAIADYGRHRVAFVRGLRRENRLVDAGSGGVRGLGFLVRTTAQRSEFREQMTAVRSPVLVVHAVDDHYVPLDFVRAAVDARPGWQLTILNRGGHYPHVREPTEWLATVEPWLQRLSA